MSKHATKLTGYITRPQLWALDQACKPIRDAFGTPPYMVGSVMERPTFRDVDVRLILSDEQYDRLTDAEWGLLGFVTSRHLAAVTGLPIDFQFQRQTQANAAYGHKNRNPLGVRGFEHHWIGDQRPEPRPAPPARADGHIIGDICPHCLRKPCVCPVDEEAAREWFARATPTTTHPTDRGASA